MFCPVKTLGRDVIFLLSKRNLIEISEESKGEKVLPWLRDGVKEDFSPLTPTLDQGNTVSLPIS